MPGNKRPNLLCEPTQLIRDAERQNDLAYK